MTLAVIDVGNTSTAAGLWRDGEVSRVVHCDGGREEAAAETAAAVLDAKPSAVAYASVVPREDAFWREWARKNALAFVAVDARLVEAAGIFTIDYPEPETIGADRLADAAGAVRRYGAPVLVMDFGTALTAAVVSSGAVWRGGAIAPGLPLARDYFNERTAKLPPLDLDAPPPPADAAPRSTREAMMFGAVYGSLGMAKEIAARLCGAEAGPVKRVATGGYAAKVLGAGADFEGFTIDRDLTLFGAGLLAAEGGAPAWA